MNGSRRSLVRVSDAERSRDEVLAERIARHFTSGTAFPEGEHGFSIAGHAGAPPAPYGVAWRVERDERWFAHALGSYYLGLERSVDFTRAGAAALLVTDRGVRVMLGAGGPDRPAGAALAARGSSHAPGTHLEQVRVRFVELEDIGAGDLLFLRAWRPAPRRGEVDALRSGAVFRVPFPRSVAALVSGLRAAAGRATALPGSEVSVAAPGASVTLDVKRRDED